MASPPVGETPSTAPFTYEPPPATGPEAEIDQAAARNGWAADVYDPPSMLVAEVCRSLESQPGELGQSPAQWLVEGKRMEGDERDILLFGVPKLCPKWEPAVKQAASGTYERWFGDGTYVVSSKPAGDGQRTIPPGRYRAEGQMDGCYWERTTEAGEIIDNNLATSARKITVTIRPSDGQFTSERCAAWKPVK